MPSYRSAAEAEIRDAVVARIRLNRPEARIIHEINVSSFGPNRIDLVAVDRAEIVAIEIKSQKDRLTRLAAQMTAMEGVAHHAIAAIHEKFLVEKKTNAWASQYERGGVHYRKDVPDVVRSKNVWAYPERPTAHNWMPQNWRFPPERRDVALPEAALNLLWRDELADLCVMLGLPAKAREPMVPLRRRLRWSCNGQQLTRGICAVLRARECPEADPAIDERAAA